jgi:hypothetical protein
MSKLTTVANAATMTKRFRDKHAVIIHQPPVGKPPYVVNGYTFSKADIDALFAQAGGAAAGLKLYTTMDDQNNMSLVAVATDSQNNDILTATDSVAWDPTKCPPACGTNNLLNS